MKLLIRSDSSSQIGLGHIMRDLVLATQYPNATILFACQNLEGNIIDKIPYPVRILSSNDPKELIDLIRTEKIDRVIFDHYGIDEHFEKVVKEATKATIVALDDTYAKHYCDILINPNIYAQSEKYQTLVPSHTILRCGREFLLIREEFYQALHNQYPSKNSIFVAMGGSDPANLTLSVLQSLPQNRPIHCVTTTSNPHLSSLKLYAASHPHITLHINASNIASLMRESVLAIITPSTIAHETLFMGLPFIAIQSADNQNEFVAYMNQAGMDVLPRFDQQVFETLLEKYR